MATVESLDSHRFEALDCIRGIAACIVLFMHILLFMQGPSALFKFDAGGGIYIDSVLDATPLRILWSGNQAVILFFVLSGLALYTMFEAIRRTHVGTQSLLVFITSRWVRLYPVYVFSIAFAMCVYWGLTWLDPRIPELRVVPDPRFDVANVLAHLAMVGVFDTTRYNGPIWSIVHEMRLSLVFPLIYFLVRGSGRPGVVVAVTIPAATTLLLEAGVDLTRHPVAASFVATLNFSVFFILGALLARFRVEVVSFIRNGSRIFRACVLVGSLGLYTFMNDPSWSSVWWLMGNLLVGISACGLIALALSFRGMERSRVLRWLGKISYSLYLMHLTCVATLDAVLRDSIPFPAIALAMSAVALIFSHATWYLVEVPSLKWSRMLRRKSQPAMRSSFSGAQ